MPTTVRLVWPAHYLGSGERAPHLPPHLRARAPRTTRLAGPGATPPGGVVGGAASRIPPSKTRAPGSTARFPPPEPVRSARNTRALPIATLRGEAIGRTSREESVSSLFE